MSLLQAQSACCKISLIKARTAYQMSQTELSMIVSDATFYVSFKLYHLVDPLQLNSQPPRVRILPFPTRREAPKPCQFI